MLARLETVARVYPIARPLALGLEGAPPIVATLRGSGAIAP
jgi:hypothetical protein